MKDILIPFFFLISVVAYGQSNESQKIDQSQIRYVNINYNAEIEIAKQLILDSMQVKNIPGLSIAIAKKNEIIWLQGFGYADLENKVPVKINTKFRIGSISKTLTAMAVGKLLDSKQLKLSDDLYKYVNYFPKKNYEITIAEIASHTSGIRDYDYDKNEYLNFKNYSSIQESVAVFQNDPLLFEPGTNYKYATYNYTLLSAVIENASSQNFIDYMQENVLKPLQLFNTTPDYVYNIIDNRARFYDKYQGIVINSPAVDNSNKWAGGGYLSTPMDLMKMCQSLLRNDFINADTKKIVWTPATLKTGVITNYGIGWRIEKDEKNRLFVHHGGSAVGGRSYLLMYPDDGIIIAVANNLSDSFNQDFILKIAKIFLK